MSRTVLLVIACCAALAAPLRAEPVTGAGSTFVLPLLGAWGQKFRTVEADGGDFPAPEGGLDYEPVGSLGGIMRVIARAVDFGATDVPLGSVDVERHGLAQFPIAMGGVAVVANLPGIWNGALRLSGEALASIYLGTIDTWSHPELKALNPDLKLPEAPITVVHRSDGSGTTYNFTAYLARASAHWRDRIGVDTEVRWPVGKGAKGSGGLAEAVKAAPHAIGYLEFGQALRTGLPAASLGNGTGGFVPPSRRTLDAAARSLDWGGAEHFALQPVAAVAPDIYPITAAVFALVPRESSDRPAGRRVLRFFDHALTRWSEDAVNLGYVPLPDDMVPRIKSYWAATLPDAPH
ncbi:phosphate ABC transporter substrate-binding protein PstS [Arenibaculum pallidiluteum]|uniref:phosphate ABC transporter substrate-binding protein PstS n=1 Tax=Arenibaculum pallidiluteum TaxID=2812559 RepID=UPI001A96CEE6|nr:phosphate ABC transporter substrate-binding protein PstS [Arenibaculum pallidiluteum]